MTLGDSVFTLVLWRKDNISLKARYFVISGFDIADVDCRYVRLRENSIQKTACSINPLSQGIQVNLTIYEFVLF